MALGNVVLDRVGSNTRVCDENRKRCPVNQRIYMIADRAVELPHESIDSRDIICLGKCLSRESVDSRGFAGTPERVSARKCP